MKTTIFVHIIDEKELLSKRSMNYNSKVEEKGTMELSGHKLFVQKIPKDTPILFYLKKIEKSQVNNHVLTMSYTHVKDKHSKFFLNALTKFCNLYFFVEKNTINEKQLKKEDLHWIASIGKVESSKESMPENETQKEFIDFVFEELNKVEINKSIVQPNYVINNKLNEQANETNKMLYLINNN